MAGFLLLQEALGKLLLGIHSYSNEQILPLVGLKHFCAVANLPLLLQTEANFFAQALPLLMQSILSTYTITCAGTIYHSPLY